MDFNNEQPVMSHQNIVGNKDYTARWVRMYVRFTLLLLLLSTALGAMLVYSMRLQEENKALSQSLERLGEMNQKQQSLLAEKSADIKNLMARDAQNATAIQDLSEKYNKVASAQTLASRSSTSRSSANTASAAFTKDLQQLKSLLTNLTHLSAAQKKNILSLCDTQKKVDEYLNALPTLLPTQGTISSRFGSRKDPFTLLRKFHSGIDIAAAKGTGIRASASGTVLLAGTVQGYGKTVILDHGHGIQTLYGHTSALLVKKGQQVKKGAVIAKVGSTGRSTGPHLHFEVRLNETPVDPSKYVTALQ